MTPEERLVADFRGTGLTVGLHPMAHHRATLKRQGVRSAIELRDLPDGTRIRIAGSVIARQRPGTAKGFVFLSLEDETGIANAIITPQLFTQNRVARRAPAISADRWRAAKSRQCNLRQSHAHSPSHSHARRRPLTRFPLATQFATAKRCILRWLDESARKIKCGLFRIQRCALQ